MRRVILLATLALACGKGETNRTFRPLAAGDPAPAYTVSRLSGDSVALADLRGNVVMLNVWATWCIPCRQEMPAMERLHQQFADSGLRIIAVSVDDRGSEGDVEQFMEEHGITFTVARDPNRKVSRTFRTIGVPETFLVDRRGVIVKRWIGEFDPASEDVKTAVRGALRG